MSRRKRTSCGPAWRITTGSLGELFRKLQAVAVRVEDVQQAHLAMQLEDDSDLDAFGSQLVRDLLHVGHVDVRDAAVFLRLALRKPDRRTRAFERRPTLLVVHSRFVEAELARVELACRSEVANVVPDRGHAARARVRVLRGTASPSSGTAHLLPRLPRDGRTSASAPCVAERAALRRRRPPCPRPSRPPGSPPAADSARR